MQETRRNVLAILTGITALCASAQDDEKLTDLIKEIETKEIHSGDAVEIWERYGRSDANVEVVKKVLFDHNQEFGNRAEAAILIGIHGGTAARDALFEYIKAPLLEVLTHEEASILCWAINSLGWIDDEIVIRELKAMASTEYWKSREVVATIEANRHRKAQDAFWTQYRFRECALIGITRLKRKDTIEIMQSLVDNDIISDMHPEAIKSYLAEARTVSDIATGRRLPPELSSEVP